MRAKGLGLVLAALCLGQAFAAELSPAQRTLFDGFAARRRVAIEYLRTGNAELGAIEIEKLRDRWAKDLRALGVANASLNVAMAAADKDVRESLAAADKGDVDAARTALERAGVPLQAWRKANGIRMFPDCINEASAVYERLDAHRGAQSLGGAGWKNAITKAAADTEAALSRCDREASPATRNDADFRRLIDGFLNSLKQVPDALRQNDADYFHRLIIEQRSFERLLAFRFG
jgi:hypothetical protein